MIMTTLIITESTDKTIDTMETISPALASPPYGKPSFVRLFQTEPRANYSRNRHEERENKSRNRERVAVLRFLGGGLILILLHGRVEHVGRGRFLSLLRAAERAVFEIFVESLSAITAKHILYHLYRRILCDTHACLYVS